MTCKNIIGKRFGRLVVLERSHKDKRNMWYCKCVCDCGNEHSATIANLNRGNVQSCGCLGEITKTKHGMTKTKTHRTWESMRYRCNNPKASNYKHYGGRGIKVCERWDDFLNFLSDMGEKPVGMQLDREDVDGDYSPDNCRWVTGKQNALNKRTTVYITYDGKTQLVQKWAEELDINYNTIIERRLRGSPVEEQLSKVPLKRGRKIKHDDNLN